MRASFSSTGDVVYELMINTDMPPDDTPMYEYSSFIVTTTGETVPLRQADRECTLALVSASGAYVGYSCAQGKIYRVDGSHVLDVEGRDLLGFDRAELGVVTADRERVWYAPLDGAPAREVAAYFEDPGAVPYEPYDYAP